MSAAPSSLTRAGTGVPARRWARQRDLYECNGALWFGYHLLDATASRVSRLLEHRLRRLEFERGLPGINTPEYMRHIWTEWDWSQGGEEWNLGADWRTSVVEDLMLPHVEPGAVAVEIGPGAGRWTAALQPVCSRLTLVDITEISMRLCRERFGGCANVDYQVSDGASLPAVADGSVDFIWSFDVFVHIAPDDQAGYMRDFARVLRPGAKAVIHHAGNGGLSGNMRSSMTRERFAELVEANGLRVLEQFERWGDGGRFELPVAGDAVTVFVR
jgi:SAM-dependent methyltransferase